MVLPRLQFNGGKSRLLNPSIQRQLGQQAQVDLSLCGSQSSAVVGGWSGIQVNVGCYLARRDSLPYSAIRRGNLTVNREPLPTTLSTRMRP
jgi:hypothetical protein